MTEFDYTDAFYDFVDKNMPAPWISGVPFALAVLRQPKYYSRGEQWANFRKISDVRVVNALDNPYYKERYPEDSKGFREIKHAYNQIKDYIDMSNF